MDPRERSRGPRTSSTVPQEQRIRIASNEDIAKRKERVM